MALVGLLESDITMYNMLQRDPSRERGMKMTLYVKEKKFICATRI